MTLKFIFDPNAEQVTWDDLDTISLIRRGDKDKVDSLRLHELLCKYMVDEQDHYLDEKRAFEILGKLRKSEIQEAMQKFMEAVQVAAIPLPRETPSSSRSELAQTASPSLDGSGT